MQENKQNIYIANDLKSFYASVECRERGLDPMTTNLVVADRSRTEKTVCLAVTFYNENGEKIEKRLNGFFARLVQHECDH